MKNVKRFYRRSLCLACGASLNVSMKLKLGLITVLLLLLGCAGSGSARANFSDGRVGARPILIVVVDKLDSFDVFQSKLPGMQRLLRESSSGLMSIRSGSGYTKTNSGYLTLNAGTRCSAPDKLSGLLEAGEPFDGITAQDFWGWAVPPFPKTKSAGLVVPEVGRVGNLNKQKNQGAIPGLLGALFHKNGWHTFVCSNSDRFEGLFRPGGLLLMDQQGVVDGGRVDTVLTVTDPNFPYLTRTDPVKAFELLKTAVKPQSIIMLDYNDFARLDYYRAEMLRAPYQRAKQATLRRFDQLLLKILTQWPAREISLIVVSPSNSLEAIKQKRFLAPFIVRAVTYRGGILTSGTTNWPGIVSNIDFLPTVMKLAQIPANRGLDGRPMRVQVGKEQDSNFLIALHQRINAALAIQRPILDWYLGLITVGWLVWFIGKYLKSGQFSEWVLTGVAAIPLVLILMPFLPSSSWQVGTFLILTVALTALLNLVSEYQTRFLVLAATTWVILVIDQATGWHLIRYSALGYSPASGARNYGMGNEFMGIFLPLALLVTELIYQKTRQRWPALLIFGVSVLVLGWPQLGINFGGTLAALTGFFWYLFRIYDWNLRNKKLWLTIGAGLTLILTVGYWDALRGVEQQTHIGRFFKLIFSNRFGQILIIIVRKLAMNLKLMIFSPWARIVWLALGISIVNRLLTKKSLLSADTKRIGQAFLVAGLAAFAFNDSGIISLATGLAFSFSYLLIAFQKEGNLVVRDSSLVVRRTKS
jgi:hypothetical protein